MARCYWCRGTGVVYGGIKCHACCPTLPPGGSWGDEECDFPGCRERAQMGPDGRPIRLPDPDMGVDFGEMGRLQLCPKHRHQRDEELRKECEEYDRRR